MLKVIFDLMIAVCLFATYWFNAHLSVGTRRDPAAQSAREKALSSARIKTN